MSATYKYMLLVMAPYSTSELQMNVDKHLLRDIMTQRNTIHIYTAVRRSQRAYEEDMGIETSMSKCLEQLKWS
jgi:hypothetical protein